MSTEKSTKRNKSFLSDFLILYTNKVEDPLEFEYEVECIAMKACKITLNFEGSDNFTVKGGKSSQTTLTSSVRPYSRQSIGSVHLIDEQKGGALRMKIQWIMEEPSEKELSTFLSAHNHKIQSVLKDAELMDFPSVLEDPNNETVSQICQTYGKSFVDKDFPPTTQALFKQSTDVTTSGEQGKIQPHKGAVEWKRPNEFMKGNYQVFVQGIEPGDIRQGALGDCWFLCAIAALTEFPELVEALFVDEALKYSDSCGAYTVRFCKTGVWQSIRVDDFFPCYPGGGPIYSRNHDNELWVMLLEKAFAKYCGSYEAIKAGWAYEAMMDLSGAPCKTIRLSDSLDVTGEKPSELNSVQLKLWEDIKRYDNENYVMSASTPGEDLFTETGRKPPKDQGTGLVAGHAYTLIAAKESSKGDRLVKLRNPWGQMEWSGDWSDSSPLWTEEMQAEIEPLVKEDDGTFWMCFEDLMRHFYSINVCMTRHPKYNPKPWFESRRRFYFYHYDENNGNGCSAPYYLLKVEEKGIFIATVHQEDIRRHGVKPYMDFGISILQKDPSGEYKLITGTGSTVERQVSTEEIELEPGEYILVPISTGIKLTQFRMTQSNARNDNSNSVSLTKLNHSTGKKEFSRPVLKVYSEVFSHMDLDSDGYLNKEEVDNFLQQFEGSELGDNAYSWLVRNFGEKGAPGLSLQGFLRSQQFIFQSTGADEEQLQRELKILGFDEQLQFSSGRAATLVLHGTSPFSLTQKSYDSLLFNVALKLPVLNGECAEYDEGKVRLYRRRTGHYGLSFVVENSHDSRQLTFELDCSSSQNMASHRQKLTHKHTLRPNESVVMHHLMPLDCSAGWSWSYCASYMWV